MINFVLTHTWQELEEELNKFFLMKVSYRHRNIRGKYCLVEFDIFFHISVQVSWTGCFGNSSTILIKLFCVMWMCVQGNELGGGTFTVYSQELKLPQHTSCHRELRPYADLMNWLKIVDNASFMKLRTVIKASYTVYLPLW